jgi:hypothetical protein
MDADGDRSRVTLRRLLGGGNAAMRCPARRARPSSRCSDSRRAVAGTAPAAKREDWAARSQRYGWRLVRREMTLYRRIGVVASETGGVA